MHRSRRGSTFRLRAWIWRLRSQGSKRILRNIQTMDAGMRSWRRFISGAAAAKDPLAAEPRFFLGLAAEQEGDKARARDIWSRLVAEAPQAAPWAQALRERLAALGAGPATTQGRLAAKIEALPEAGRMNAIR